MTARRIFLLVITLLGMAVTGALGRWQLARAAEKQAVLAAEQAAAKLPPVDIAALAMAQSPEQIGALAHRHVSLEGHWIAERTVYLDNRVMGQRSGFYVATPLRLDGGRGDVLVLRGWVPRNFDNRTALPQVQTPSGEVRVSGRVLTHVPSSFALGHESPGPIRQNIDLPAFARETGLPLVAAAVQQTGRLSEGLERDWPPPASGAGTNFSYAFQWFSLCALMGGLFIWFQLVRPLRSIRRGPIGP